MPSPRHRALRAWGVGLLLGAATLAAHASAVSMEPAELQALRSLVAGHKGAAAVFVDLRRTADDALTQAPNPAVRVDSAGRLKSDPAKIRTEASLKDIEKVEALAWTWAVTGDTRYAGKAREIINAWARTNQSDGLAINETKFEPLIEGYDLLRPDYPAAERQLVDGWLQSKARALLTSQRVQHQNHQSHRLKVVGLIAATIGDAELWRQADQGFKRQMLDNYDREGVSVDFKRRDALHYHLYGVQPLLTLACVAQRRGEPLFTYQAPNGATLRAAVEFTRPYALGDRTHLEFEHTQVKFDRERAKAGERAYAVKPWNPKNGVRLFSEAGCVDPAYDTLAAQVAGTPGRPFLNWRAVLNAVGAPARPR